MTLEIFLIWFEFLAIACFLLTKANMVSDLTKTLVLMPQHLLRIPRVRSVTLAISGATSAADVVANLSTETQVGFSAFSDAALDAAGIYCHASDYAADQSFNNLERIRRLGDKAFVTLQENNAIAVIDLNTNTVESINDLGITTVTVDASDKNGVAVDDVVKGIGHAGLNEVFEAGRKNLRDRRFRR